MSHRRILKTVIRVLSICLIVASKGHCFEGDQIIRKASEYVRQGQYDAAIAEYD